MKHPITKIVNKISDKGYPTSNYCYKQAHKKANKSEINHYGKRQFDKLNNLIKTIIPKGELAGKHTKQNTILISKRIPAKYRDQIKFHELVELNDMKEKGC